jgi:hypothetical protein
VAGDAKKSNSTATQSKGMCIAFDLLLLHEDQSGCIVFSMKQQGLREDILLYIAPKQNIEKHVSIMIQFFFYPIFIIFYAFSVSLFFSSARSHELS